MVKDAPTIEDDGRIEGSEDEALYTYYEGYLGTGTQNTGPQGQGQEYAGDTARTCPAGATSRAGAPPGTPPMTEVRLEREPMTDADRGQATSGADISEEEHEVTLHAERPVTNKETVPVERVRLGEETVTEDHEVNETLRKEQSHGGRKGDRPAQRPGGARRRAGPCKATSLLRHRPDKA